MKQPKNKQFWKWLPNFPGKIRSLRGYSILIDGLHCTCKTPPCDCLFRRIRPNGVTLPRRYNPITSALLSAVTTQTKQSSDVRTMSWSHHFVICRFSVFNRGHHWRGGVRGLHSLPSCGTPIKHVTARPDTDWGCNSDLRHSRLPTCWKRIAQNLTPVISEQTTLFIYCKAPPPL